MIFIIIKSIDCVYINFFLKDKPGSFFTDQAYYGLGPTNLSPQIIRI